MHSTQFITFILTFALSSTLFAASPKKQAPPNVDLEASTREYLQYFEQQKFKMDINDPFAPILLMGKRNIEWLNLLNKNLPKDQQIRLTTPGTLKGIPMESPLKYSGTLILSNYQSLRTTLPPAMKTVLIDGDTMPATLPVSKEDYIIFSKNADRIYELAARWKMLTPSVPYLEKKREKDVRGFYFLRQIQNLPQELNEWPQLPTEKQIQYTEWLKQMCLNNFGLTDSCENKVKTAIAQNKVYSFYSLLEKKSQSVWSDYFKITSYRQDFSWNSRRPNLFSAPFQEPDNERVRRFLQENIEDEFRNSIWNLKLNFVRDDSAPRVEFQPGVTPHADHLGGGLIVMDANASLEEWDNQWTIRHEFGHILGFPDCYLEFYDPKEAMITAYQLDTSNLMCSRAGKFQDLHYEELKKVYFKN